MFRSLLTAVVLTLVLNSAISVRAEIIEVSVDVNGAGTGGGTTMSSAATGPVTLSDTHSPSTASVTADYLSVTGSASTSAAGSMFFDPNSAIANGIWKDALTISSAGMAGSTGTLEIDYRIEGTFSASSSGGLVGTAAYDASFTSSEGGFSSQSGGFSSTTGFLGPGGTSDGTGTFTSDPLDFLFGSAFDLEVSLMASAIGDINTDGATGSASASATDVKLTWLAFRVFDGGGMQVTSASVSSDSGSNYNFSGSGGGATIPEPSSILLLTLATAGVFCRRSRVRAAA